MSLLMDALRKAEEAKRASAQAGTASSSTHDLPPEEADTAKLSELTLEPLDAHVEASAPISKPSSQAKPLKQPMSAAQTEAQRSAIQNAFTAKAPPKTSIDRAFITALVAVGGLCLIGGCVYVWLQMQPRSGVAPLPEANTSLASLPPLPQTASAPPQAAAEASAPQDKPPIDEAATHLFAPPPEARTTPPAREERRSSTRGEPGAEPIRLSRSKPRVNPLLEDGYAALQQGNYAQAQQAYERMLNADNKNLDALYGLAAIAVARKQSDMAEEYFLRILEVDPRDPVAQSGLTGLTARAGSTAESRLKTLIADQPDVPQLQFALGNVYAQNQRWRDAQQAYFLAYKNDSENPDAAFNLAVSLDQLRQEKLAAQYYGEALRLSGQKPATFNRSQVQARLTQLQGAGAP